MRHPVFISYAHADEFRLHEFFICALTDYAWFDRLMIGSNDKDWVSQIINGIADCTIILVVGNWHLGAMTLIELSIGHCLNKPIIFLEV